MLSPSKRQGAHRYIGPYLLQGMLGYGNMGVVYRAWDERLDRPVALKRLRPNGDDIDDRRQRFRREARAIAQLSHAHIVRLYDLLETEQGDWLVMELVIGQSLEELLEDGPLPAGRLLRIAHQITQGLEEAHHYGIIHRDLKPENVLLDLKERAKIFDFGLAKFVDTTQTETETTAQDQFLTSAGVVVGTPHAMAPEQIRDQRIDARCDLFALGVLIYQGLTGDHPFYHKNPTITLTNILRKNPPALSTLLPRLPSELAELVDTLMAKRPEDRPDNANLVSRRLARIARTLNDDPPLAAS